MCKNTETTAYLRINKVKHVRPVTLFPENEEKEMPLEILEGRVRNAKNQVEEKAIKTSKYNVVSVILSSNFAVSSNLTIQAKFRILIKAEDEMESEKLLKNRKVGFEIRAEIGEKSRRKNDSKPVTWR